MNATAKQRATIYTMMLIVAFVALVTACVMMYLELKKYKFDIEAKEYKNVRSRPTVVLGEEWVV